MPPDDPRRTLKVAPKLAQRMRASVAYIRRVGTNRLPRRLRPIFDDGVTASSVLEAGQTLLERALRAKR